MTPTQTTKISNQYQPSHAKAAPVVDSLTAASATLAEFEQARAILAGTHTEIPQLLAQRRELTSAVGTAENSNSPKAEALRDQLGAVELKLEGATRRRRSAVQSLAVQEADLQAARAAASDALTQHAGQVITEFQNRYKECVRNLQSLWSEADMLSLTLRVKVHTPLPCRLVSSAMQPAALARIMPDAPITPPVISAATTRLAQLLDGLDGALQVCSNVRSSDARAKSLATVETRHGWDAHGLYRVQRTFNSSLTAQPFPVGTLVNESILDLVSLYRLVTTKHLIPAGA
jgi:hypothetical protein